MSSVKSQGFSHYKGKAVASDSPAIPKEMERSDLERSAEEEMKRNPDNECAPLIDPWHEIDPYFPKIPGKYVPPSLGRVLLAFVRRNPNVSWAPLASLILDLSICQGTSLPVTLHFEFGFGTASGWKEWVDSELSDTGFMSLLQRAGALKAVVSSRCLSNLDRKSTRLNSSHNQRSRMPSSA